MTYRPKIKEESLLPTAEDAAILKKQIQRVIRWYGQREGSMKYTRETMDELAFILEQLQRDYIPS